MSNTNSNSGTKSGTNTEIDTEIYIVAAKRTPIGKFGGGWSKIPAVELASRAIQGALKSAAIDSEIQNKIDLVTLGLARQAGCGPNPARQAMVRSGLSPNIPAYTINQACASGLSAVYQGAQNIALGEANLVVAAGAENMSLVPYLMSQARWGQKMGHQTLVDAMYKDGLHCPLCDQIMGETVQALAEEFGIERQEQDDFAVASHHKAAQADFSGERLTFSELDHDEHLRPQATSESFAKLPPVFHPQGNITAANSSGITDGASCIVLASAKAVREYGLSPLARWHGAVCVGLEPARMGLGPTLAIPKLLERLGWSMPQIDRFEINEAFAAQVLACNRQLQIPLSKLNARGGAIAIGHPIGCSGNRILVSLVDQLHQDGQGRGVASLCVSGGLGIAAAISAPN